MLLWSAIIKQQIVIPIIVETGYNFVLIFRVSLVLDHLDCQRRRKFFLCTQPSNCIESSEGAPAPLQCLGPTRGHRVGEKEQNIWGKPARTSLLTLFYFSSTATKLTANISSTVPPRGSAKIFVVFIFEHISPSSSSRSRSRPQIVLPLFGELWAEPLTLTGGAFLEFHPVSSSRREVHSGRIWIMISPLNRSMFYPPTCRSSWDAVRET